MARDRVKPSTEKLRRQAQEKRPQGIEKRPQPLRRSARLQEARQNDQAKPSLPSPPTTNPLGLKALYRSPPPEPKAVPPSCPKANLRPERKRKRSQDVEAPQGPSKKRPRTNNNGNRPPADNNINGKPTDVNGSGPLADNNGDPPADSNGDQSNVRLQTWLRGESYPAEYFEPGDRTWEDIKADTLARRLEVDGMGDPRLARKKSASSLRQDTPEENTDVPMEKTEDKSQPYRSPGYVAELADQGSYLYEAPEGIIDESKHLCQRLLTTEQALPQDSDFSDNKFEEICYMVRDRNEARVVEDISPLVAPSPEKLRAYGAEGLEHLIYNIDERWSESVPVTKTRPQPDGSVGFKRSAFTDAQVEKLLPYIGNRVPYDYLSLFLATWQTFFPFFAREAKGGMGDLDVADRQNAHSMTMAVRGIIELFKLVHRESELHRKVLAFSISHDATIVRIYGHYAKIEERKPTFYRHPIHSFDFTAQNGKEKWTAYRFTKNVYFEFMPDLHERICSAIDQLQLKVAPPRLLSNPPQQIPLNASFGTDTDLESEQTLSQDIATSAPGSQNSLGLKKRRLTGNAILERRLDRKDEELERIRQHSGENLERLRQENERLRQSANSGNDSEVVAMLRQELERQRQVSERQRQETEQQRKEMKEENERQRQEIERQRKESEEKMEKLLQRLLEKAEN